jgi:hypothetical protein
MQSNAIVPATQQQLQSFDGATDLVEYDVEDVLEDAD